MTNRGIPDGGEDVQLCQTPNCVDLPQRAGECLVEDVADPCASAQLCGLYVLRSTVNSIAICSGELGDNLQQNLILESLYVYVIIIAFCAMHKYSG